MKCDRCRITIPENQRKRVSLNGLPVIVPFCTNCIEEIWEKFDNYVEEDEILEREEESQE